MSRLPSAIAAEALTLFHDTRLEDVDPEDHARFVMERVLCLGTTASVRALFRFYGRTRIATAFREGSLRVDRRTRALWHTYFGIEESRCEPTRSPRISSPFYPR